MQSGRENNFNFIPKIEKRISLHVSRCKSLIFYPLKFPGLIQYIRELLFPSKMGEKKKSTNVSEYFTLIEILLKKYKFIFKISNTI